MIGWEQVNFSLSLNLQCGALQCNLRSALVRNILRLIINENCMKTGLSICSHLKVSAILGEFSNVTRNSNPNCDFLY